MPLQRAGASTTDLKLEPVEDHGSRAEATTARQQVEQQQDGATNRQAAQQPSAADGRRTRDAIDKHQRDLQRKRSASKHSPLGRLVEEGAEEEAHSSGNTSLADSGDSTSSTEPSSDSDDDDASRGRGRMARRRAAKQAGRGWGFGLFGSGQTTPWYRRARTSSRGSRRRRLSSADEETGQLRPASSSAKAKKPGRKGAAAADGGGGGGGRCRKCCAAVSGHCFGTASADGDGKAGDGKAEASGGSSHWKFWTVLATVVALVLYLVIVTGMQQNRTGAQPPTVGWTPPPPPAGANVLPGVHCNAGQFIDPRDPRQCVDCPRGQVDHDSDGRSPCLRCIAGSYAAQAAVRCSPCSAGMVDHDHDAESPCINCPVGSYSPIGATNCAPCPRGSVDADGDSATQCHGCLAGQVVEDGAIYAAAFEQASSAQPSNTSVGVVVPPPSGAFSSSHSTMNCVDCTVGMHDHDSDPSTGCVPCAPGTFAAAGVTECALCPSGMADLDSNPGTPCVACPSSAHACFVSQPGEPHDYRWHLGCVGQTIC